jgi:hypothetical protein
MEYDLGDVLYFILNDFGGIGNSQLLGGEVMLDQSQ